MASTWVPQGFGPYRLVVADMQVQPKTPIRDFIKARIEQLRAERLNLSQDQRGEAVKRRVADHLADEALVTIRRREQAVREWRRDQRSGGETRGSRKPRTWSRTSSETLRPVLRLKG